MKLLAWIALAACASGQAFEVATIKPTPNDWRAGRYMRMTGERQFVATNYTPRVLIAAAFELNPQAVAGGPAWIDSDSYDVAAVTPGEVRPNLSQQLAMVRELPARNATMAQVAAVLQRSVFDRPILDRTGLGAQRFDFDLVWAPDETQFGGRVPGPPDLNLPSFFTAVQEQLGLKFEAARGPVMALVIDRIERPGAN